MLIRPGYSAFRNGLSVYLSVRLSGRNKFTHELNKPEYIYTAGSLIGVVETNRHEIVPTYSLPVEWKIFLNQIYVIKNQTAQLLR